MELLTKISFAMLDWKTSSFDLYCQSFLVGTIPPTFYRLLFFANFTTEPPKGMPGKGEEER
jgi:hypothetical protein